MNNAPKHKKPNPLKHLRASDLAAVAQLATQATLGVTRMAEGVHQSVWRTLGAPGTGVPGQARGVTGLIYKAVRGVADGVVKGIGLALMQLQPLFAIADQSAPETPQREAVLAALNGVLGDHLAQSGNPLATQMTIRWQHQPLNWQTGAALPELAHQATGKVLLLIHGLCMNDLQWQTAAPPPVDGADAAPSDHGQVLAQALGYTPVYLRYNSGLHTSINGRELSRQMEQLVQKWPVGVTDLTVLVHSMGGLIVRSALVAAAEESLNWPLKLKNIIFLGTPHHGAPLERAGNWLDVILGSTPYSRPFAKLGQLRSAGITDLRYGHVVDADWQGHDRFRKKPDSRTQVPLPPPRNQGAGVACYSIAATLSGPRSPMAERLIGDGLVPLPSALGEHADPARTLAFDESARRIVYRTSHMALLSSPEVARQLVTWLTVDSGA